MKQTKEQTAIANKIKKWLKTAQETETETRYFGLPITRLTSIKSLCKDDEISAQQFALFIMKRIFQKMNEMSRPERFSVEEWDSDKQLIAESINQMENYLETPSSEGNQRFRTLLREIENRQGDDIRRVHWNTIHFVRSGYLLKLEYSLGCFIDHDFPYWVYKLAREYVEQKDGITTESVPMLLEVAEFWCQYYFGNSLTEKFPNLIRENNLILPNSIV